jgi:HPt (histidine-containing phosphotransfer) domain-containing protein
VLENSIDETVLNGLGELKRDSPEFALKIVGLYLDTTPSILKKLETAALADDLHWLRLANHSLSSVSAAVGAVQVVARCNELDRMLRAGSVIEPPSGRGSSRRSTTGPRQPCETGLPVVDPADETANRKGRRALRGVPGSDDAGNGLPMIRSRTRLDSPTDLLRVPSRREG